MLGSIYRIRVLSTVYSRNATSNASKMLSRSRKQHLKLIKNGSMINKCMRTPKISTQMQQIAFRFYGSVPTVKDMNKAELKAILSGDPDNYTLIDVREQSELQYGQIPNSHHIPLGSIPEHFAKSANDFEDDLGFPKPAPTDHVIFYCKAGARSASAAAYLLQQGYRNVSNYPGFIDWFGKGY